MADRSPASSPHSSTPWNPRPSDDTIAPLSPSSRTRTTTTTAPPSNPSPASISKSNTVSFSSNNRFSSSSILPSPFTAPAATNPPTSSRPTRAAAPGAHAHAHEHPLDYSSPARQEEQAAVDSNKPQRYLKSVSFRALFFLAICITYGRGRSLSRGRWVFDRSRQRLYTSGR